MQGPQMKSCLFLRRAGLTSSCHLALGSRTSSRPQYQARLTFPVGNPSSKFRWPCRCRGKSGSGRGLIFGVPPGPKILQKTRDKHCTGGRRGDSIGCESSEQAYLQWTKDPRVYGPLRTLSEGEDLRFKYAINNARHCAVLSGSLQSLSEALIIQHRREKSERKYLSSMRKPESESPNIYIQRQLDGRACADPVLGPDALASHREDADD